MAFQLFKNPFAFLSAILLVSAVPATAQNGTGFSLGAHELDPLDPPVTTADPTGSYNVGVRRETYSFDGRQLNVSWWYPAIVTDESTQYLSSGGIVGEAVGDADLDTSGGTYPLIVFSPGLGAHDDTYFFYVQNLASSGYIVVSINHLDATEAAVGANALALVQAEIDMANNDSSDTVCLLYSKWFRSTQFALTYRPQEIQYVLDQAVAADSDSSSFFSGVMDIENIGMTGHSLGGFYTLIKGAGLAIYCDYELTPAEANTANPILTEVNMCAFPEAEALSGPFALYDSRVKAVISLAPPSFIRDEQLTRSAAAITAPMMILTGNDPKYESTQAPQQAIYHAASGPKYKVEIDATNHLLVSEAYQFNDPGDSVPAEDKENFPEKAEVYMVYSSAFFDVYLKGDTAREETLHTPSSSFVADLEYSD